MPVTSVPWSDLVDEMQTGDLILFSGVSAESEWIKIFTGGLFSHSTMIYRPDPTQAPQLWQEAPKSIVRDPHTGTSHGGAQLGDAFAATSEIYLKYHDTPYYVKLNWERPSTLAQTVLDVVNKYEERPFGTVLEMALNYALGHLYNQGTDQSAIYCAELVAITFQAIGILDTSHPPNWYSPNSFGTSVLNPITWQDGVTVSEPVQIMLPGGGEPVEAAGVAEQWPAGPLAPSELAMPPAPARALVM
ncbi:MAG TPA: hypothetical protein VMF33_05150 [Acidimicrobiales bacterium]|nr:hypothetical protein [Acidimicrobiales bacterium]